MLNFEQLQTFRTIARSGTFSGAADELFLTQPAISQRISHLEQALGLDLFHRDSGRRTLRLTVAGEQVLRFADDVIARMERLHIDLMSADHQGKPETITIASGPMFSKYILLSLVTAYSRRYPNVRVKLIEADCERIGDAIRSGEVDLGVLVERYVGGSFHLKPLMSPAFSRGSRRVAKTYHDDSFLFIPLIRDKVSLVAAPDHPGASDTELWLGKTRVLSYVSPLRSSRLRQLAEDWSAFLEVKLDEVVETTNLDFLKQAVVRGLGVSLVSQMAVADEVRDGTLKVLPAPGLPQARQFCLVFNGRQAHSAAVRSFIEMAREGIWRSSLPGSLSSRSPQGRPLRQ